MSSKPKRRVPLTPAQRELAAAYLPFAKKKAGEAASQFPHLADDFRDTCLERLCLAAQSFDARRGVKFATYLGINLCGAVADVKREAMKREGRRGNSQQRAFYAEPAAQLGRLSSTRVNGELLLPFGFHEWNSGEVMDPINPPDAGEAVDVVAERMEWVERILARMPERHRNLVRLVYLEGMSQAAAAERLGISKSRASYIMKDALAEARYAAELAGETDAC